MARAFQMVPIDMSPRQFAAMRRNIENVYRNATPEQVREGQTWYERANQVATEVGRGDTSSGAAAIAALSPKTKYELNVEMARQLSRTPARDMRRLQGVADAPKDERLSVHRELFQGTPLGRQTTENVLKAHTLLNEGAAPEDLLPMARKTGHFYRNINDPSDPEPITIDTVAHDLAIKRTDIPWKVDRGLQAQGRYNLFHSAYAQSAERLDVDIPNHVQAVTWLARPERPRARRR